MAQSVKKASKADETPQKQGRSEPRRVRWSVPTADVSVNQWLDLQDSISDSLRLLIRESIQRDGYIDVANRPLEQQPRRGRPVGSGDSQQSRPVGTSDGQQIRPMGSDNDSQNQQNDSGDTSAEYVSGVHTETMENGEEIVMAPTRHGKGYGKTAPGQQDLETASDEHEDEEHDSPDDAPNGGQVDMNAIFGH